MNCNKMTETSSFSTDIEKDLFFFESEHLALRGNKDYCEVLKTIFILSAQREQLLKDQKRILEIRNEVLKDPDAVVKKLENNENLGLELPPAFETVKMPEIKFDSYNVKIPDSLLKETKSETDHEIKIEENLENTKYNRREWTTEELNKLEELLKTYPPEPIESRRYQKIANALGNRTLAQVTSKVQKYFQKLHKAGLPIPGRIPKSVSRYNRGASHQRYSEPLWRPTTFFPEYNVPVELDDDDAMDCTPGPTPYSPGPTPHSPGPTPKAPGPTPSISRSTPHAPGPTSRGPPAPMTTYDNYLLQTDYHLSTSSKENRNVEKMKKKLLERVVAEKAREEEDPMLPFIHIQFGCALCGERPIVGTRWHCEDCSEPVDYCTDCTIIQMHGSDPHPPGHFLAAIRDGQEEPCMVSRSELFSDDSAGSDSDSNFSEGEDTDCDGCSTLACVIEVERPVKNGNRFKSKLGGSGDGSDTGEESGYVDVVGI